MIFLTLLILSDSLHYLPVGRSSLICRTRSLGSNTGRSLNVGSRRVVAIVRIALPGSA